MLIFVSGSGKEEMIVFLIFMPEKQKRIEEKIFDFGSAFYFWKKFCMKRDTFNAFSRPDCLPGILPAGHLLQSHCVDVRSPKR